VNRRIIQKATCAAETTMREKLGAMSLTKFDEVFWGTEALQKYYDWLCVFSYVGRGLAQRTVKALTLSSALPNVLRVFYFHRRGTDVRGWAKETQHDFGPQEYTRSGALFSGRGPVDL
jgi:hypothetical protein